MHYELYCMTKTYILIRDTKALKTQVENLKFTLRIIQGQEISCS